MKKIIKSLLGTKGTDTFRKFKNKVAGKKELFDKNEIAINKLFFSKFINSGDLCFDVGANMGTKVQPLLEINARVIAIEPQEYCQHFLRKKFHDKIVLVTKGLGAKEEIKDFYISDSNTISSFSKEWIDEVSKRRFKDHQWNTVKKIEITTLDKLIEQYGIPSFIKIDVEGFELEVLKGLTKPVSMICFEYTIPEQTDVAINCINTILSINPNIECNYVSLVKMDFVLDKWEDASTFIQTMKGKEFFNTGHGDIYVRNKIFQN